MNLCDKPFFVTVDDYLCKFFPRENHDELQVFCENPIEKQFIFGFDEDDSNVALMFQWSIPSPKYPSGFKMPNYFPLRTNVIIKGLKYPNEQFGLDMFDAISFGGYVVNCVYSPAIALDIGESQKSTLNDGPAIKFSPADSYVKKYPLELFGEKCTLVLYVSHSGMHWGSPEKNPLGDLHSFLRLEFDNPRKTENIERYYFLFENFFAFCIGQYNIKFDEIQMFRKIERQKVTMDSVINSFKGIQSEEETEITLDRIGICKFRDDFFDHAKPEWFKTIQLGLFGDKVKDALEFFADDTKKPLLVFLPFSNAEKMRVSISNIKDLQSAFEVEYKRYLASGEFKKTKQDQVEGLKKTLRSAVDSHTLEVEIDEKLANKARSIVGNIDLTAADKICILRDFIMSKIDWTDGNCPTAAFELTDEEIVSYVDVRNVGTHSDSMSAHKNIVNIYQKLSRILYLSILIRIGLTGEQLRNSLCVLQKML